jgi:HAD superfamily hydrolase (TIGR01509 family)
MIEGVGALIFDVDGTLSETEEAHRLSFNTAFAEAGLDWVWPRDLYRELLKVTGGKERITHYMRMLGLNPAPAFVAGLHARKTEIYIERVAAGEVALRQGIEALILEARRRGLPLAIATTTSRPNVDALIAGTLGDDALAWFHPMACGDMVAAKKPAPDVYLAALAGIGVPADRCLALEDSWNGVRSARSAGLRVLAIPSLYSAGDDFSEATEVAPDAASIMGVLGWVE